MIWKLSSVIYAAAEPARAKPKDMFTFYVIEEQRSKPWKRDMMKSFVENHLGEKAKRTKEERWEKKTYERGAQQRAKTPHIVYDVIYNMP